MTIPLDRRFRRATETEDRSFRRLFGGGFKYHSTWADLVAARRVVILAEAGSGKSTEFETQCAALESAGAFAFHVSVADVAQAGFEGALVPKARARLSAWRTQQDAECWIFMDSVDEARDQDLPFAAAARNLADAIVGREKDVHLYVSSRFTDWDATADRSTMEKWLALPEPPPAPAPAPDFEQEVRDTLHNKERTGAASPDDPVAILVLEPLEREQVRRFAQGSGITDADAFLAEVEHGNLWSFAARPLDLGWMTDYWRTHGRLGTLRQMIEASLRARLLDPDRNRRRNDPIDPSEANRALDRIGASFLFCGGDSLRVPVSGIELAPAGKSMPLEIILPDWSDGPRLLLLGRPVFDPATLGRTRLHNDNEGTLRCFLAARWLAERLRQNCPLHVVFDILFDDRYGYRLVRPDMVETSAWLAGENAAVAEELIARAPINLLRNGDPGSLPVETRIRAFGAALDQADTVDREKLWLLEGGMKRFADPALDAHLPRWWARAAASQEARHLILRLVWHGLQRGGLGIAREAAFDKDTDEITQLLGVRALLALGDREDRGKLADHIRGNPVGLGRSTVLEGLANLVPEDIAVPEFFALIDEVGVKGDDGHVSILPIDGDLVGALQTEEVVAQFVNAIVARSGDLRGDQHDHPFREAFSVVGAQAALKWLEWHPDDVPESVTDLVLLLHETSRRSGMDIEFKRLGEAFDKSPGRRRSSFWRAVERLRSHPYVTDSNDVNVWFVQHLGWPVTLGLADLEWLAVDIKSRTEPRDRLLALRAAHSLWRQLSENEELIDAIARAAAGEQALAEQLAAWRNPPPDPPEHVRQMKSYQEAQKRNEAQAEERDGSWVDLIATLREDPTAFDRLSEQTEESVDSRLFHLWQFLSWRTTSRSRHSIDSLDAVATVFGPELTERFGEALVAFAYNRLPAAGAEGAAAPLRTTNFDIMALAGLSLAAATKPNWARDLSAGQATAAARIATAELNGFPDYTASLATSHPAQVRAVLAARVMAQLASADRSAHGMLDRLEYADGALARVIAPDLVGYLDEHPEIGPVMLEKVVSILLRAMPFDIPSAGPMVARRISEASDGVSSAYYLLLLFGLEGEAAVDAMREKMGSLAAGDQASLCCALLPRLVGGRLNRAVSSPAELSAARLEQLLILAFEGVRPSEDIERPSGKVYSPEPRDEAQDARNMIFDRLTKTPGEATHAALRRLEAIPDFPIPPEWIRVHAERRAEADAELPAWAAEDVVRFERTFGHPPTTTADLQLLARRRLEGIQHDLVDGKFAQGDTLQMLPDENSVQRWIATQLEARQNEAYTVQRETHYAEEKEPDVTLTSRHSGVELPIEIKVVDGLSIRQLEAALTTQLCGQYLRHATARHGILLLAFQRPRPEGWLLDGGPGHIGFAEVVDRLRSQARSIREESATGPQPVVEMLDVSTVVPLAEKRRAARLKAGTGGERNIQSLASRPRAAAPRRRELKGGE